MIWDLDQVPVRGIEQVKEWYTGFPVKASACVECGVCMERCPFDVEIINKMREAAEVFEGQVAQGRRSLPGQRDDELGASKKGPAD